MNALDLPLILDPNQLEAMLGREELVIVDLSKESLYRQVHIPGAVHLDYPKIVDSRKPVHGLLPDSDYLADLFGNIGIGNSTQVVAYDDEGGGKAGRLLWTLEALGHPHFSLLDGGLNAWVNEGHPRDNKPVIPAPARFTPNLNPEVIADAGYILTNLDNPQLLLLDARSPEEFNGSKRFAERGGHIPGAVNWDWTEAMDKERNLHLKPEQGLLHTLEGLGVIPDKEVVVYCHTHHRSSYTYIVLKHLGFRRVRGYHGSWSDWGNRQDTPIS
jgi:thiosulfate/3-mercaptopyruvate sulfurtransferase